MILRTLLYSAVDRRMDECHVLCLQRRRRRRRRRHLGRRLNARTVAVTLDGPSYAVYVGDDDDDDDDDDGDSDYRVDDGDGGGVEAPIILSRRGGGIWWWNHSIC